MNVNINIDSFLPIFWSKKYGDRSFQFDAFISHNGSDKHSKRLAQELKDRGAKVWHDNDQDLNNRKVQEMVHSALIGSRFIILCVDDCFHDSPWCRAEYLPAIEVESQAQASRLIIAHMVPHSVVPPNLSNHPLYVCNLKEELDRLAITIKSGNNIPFNKNWRRGHRLKTPKTNDLISSYNTMIRDRGYKVEINSIVLQSLYFLLDPFERQNSPQRLMATRQMLIENVKLSDFSEQEFSFLVSSSIFFCRLSNSDDRANGIYMLLHLSEHYPKSYLIDALLRILGEEPDRTILSLGFPFFEKNFDSFNIKQRSMVEFLAHRNPNVLSRYYPRSTMVRDFSEVTRVKVFNRGLETDILSDGEKMKLLEERYDYLHVSNKVFIITDSPLDKLRPIMRISDLEIIFREMNQLLFKTSYPIKQETNIIAPRILALIDRVVSESKQHQGFPLLFMEEWIIDFILKPLLFRCLPLEDIRESTMTTFSDVCSVVEQYSSLSFEVPFYRQYLEIAAQEADISNGLSSECFRDVNIGLIEAHSKHQQLHALLKSSGLIE